MNQMHGERVDMLRRQDDIALIANSEQYLQKIFKSMYEVIGK